MRTNWQRRAMREGGGRAHELFRFFGISFKENTPQSPRRDGRATTEAPIHSSSIWEHPDSLSTGDSLHTRQEDC